MTVHIPFGWVHPLLAYIEQASLTVRLYEKRDIVEQGSFSELAKWGEPMRSSPEYYLPILICPSDPPTAGSPD